MALFPFRSADPRLDGVVVNFSGSSERRRVAACVAVGVIAAVLSLLVAPWQLGVLIGWVTTAALLLVWVWLEIGRLDAPMTAQVATREDDSRAAARSALVASSIMSLIAVVHPSETLAYLTRDSSGPSTWLVRALLPTVGSSRWSGVRGSG